MTRIVAIDTSTWWEGVALVESSSSAARCRVVAEAGVRVEDSHTAHVLNVLEALMAEAGWSRGDVDGYAATRGPGSFTGLRIGLGTVLGLGLAAERPCCGIGTLDALAVAHGPDVVERIAVMDAGRREVYATRFTAASFPPQPKTAPTVGPPEDLVETTSSPAVVFGEGAELYRDILTAGGTGLVVRSTPTSVAAAAGILACARLERGAKDGEGMAPLYIRPPDAVLKRPEQR